MRSLITRLLADEEGASAIEYALIAGLIAAVLVTVLTNLGTGIRDTFQSILDALPGGGGGGSAG